MGLKRQTIRKSIVLLILGTVLSKILGFVREILVAYKFGASNITDAFVLTNSIPPIIFSALGSAITISFIPIYQGIKNDKEKNRFTSNLINIILIILGVGCTLICLFPEAVLKCFGAGMQVETKSYAIVLLRISAFSIFPVTLTHLFQAFSQAKESFVSTSIYGTITNIIAILFILMAFNNTYWLLSVGTVTASFVGMLVVLAIAVYSGFRYTPVLNFREDYLKGMVVLALPLIVEDIASNMTVLVDKNLASFMDEGTITGLGYAGMLGTVASTLVATSVITATFPTFSRMIIEGQHEEFEKKFLSFGKVILFIMCPIAGSFIFFAKDIVVLIFEHGAFSSAASKIVWESLICYAIGIVPSSMQSYFLRIFYALKNTKTPVCIKLFSFFCNIVLNLASYRTFGHIGIAMSTSVSFVIAYILLGYFLIKKYRYTAIHRISGIMVLNMLCVSIIGAAVAFLFGKVIVIRSTFVCMVAEMAVFLGVYFLIELVIDADTVKRTLRKIR